eukprot:10337092-Heterocapsa_arctica.AAC.1
MQLRPLLFQSGFKYSLLKEAKYLGSTFSAEGSNAPETCDRLENRAWRLLGRTQQCSSVSCRVRLIFFRATVLGVLLSGLEAVVLARDQLKQLE